MRSGNRIAVVALATALAVSACTSGDVGQPKPDSTIDPAPDLGFSELLVLALAGDNGSTGQWHVNDSRDVVAYELRTHDGHEVWVVDDAGTRAVIAGTNNIDEIEFTDSGHVAISDKDESTGQHRILYSAVDGIQPREVATSQQPLAIVGYHDGEVFYSGVGDQSIELFAWNAANGETRQIGEIAQEFPDVYSVASVGSHVVFESSSGDTQQLFAMSMADGAVVAVPQHDPSFTPRLLGEAPNGDSLFAAGRRGGGYIYMVDLNKPERMTELTNSAVVELVFMEGSSVRYTTTNGETRLFDLVTRLDSPAPSRAWEPPSPVRGLDASSARLIATLEGGNWIVTGWLVAGAEYRALWDISEQFGGGTSDELIPVKGLFEYDPETQQLWQMSGPPTFSSTTTSAGSGTGPDGVLRVEVLNGFVVFSTGFSGAAYDIEYNLYASPIPSLLES
ncbi:MAG: hypothetical protein HKN91_04890 [Acidimicrobiia bacterium]|nr:hypothetical protein [Acidimicrobiia bacterium]